MSDLLCYFFYNTCHALLSSTITYISIQFICFNIAVLIVPFYKLLFPFRFLLLLDVPQMSTRKYKHTIPLCQTCNNVPSRLLHIYTICIDGSNCIFFVRTDMKPCSSNLSAITFANLIKLRTLYSSAKTISGLFLQEFNSRLTLYQR